MSMRVFCQLLFPDSIVIFGAVTFVAGSNPSQRATAGSAATWPTKDVRLSRTPRPVGKRARRSRRSQDSGPMMFCQVAPSLPRGERLLVGEGGRILNGRGTGTRQRHGIAQGVAGRAVAKVG